LLHLGTIQGSRVEQVRSLPYSLDALLGIDTDNPPDKPTFTNGVEQRDGEIVTHREFANVNGIEYSLDQLLRVSPGC
jgi:phosphatidylserine decarboxylase